MCGMPRPWSGAAWAPVSSRRGGQGVSRPIGPSVRRVFVPRKTADLGPPWAVPAPHGRARRPCTSLGGWGAPTSPRVCFAWSKPPAACPGGAGLLPRALGQSLQRHHRPRARPPSQACSGHPRCHWALPPLHTCPLHLSCRTLCPGTPRPEDMNTRPATTPLSWGRDAPAALLPILTVCPRSVPTPGAQGGPAGLLVRAARVGGGHVPSQGPCPGPSPPEPTKCKTCAGLGPRPRPHPQPRPDPEAPPQPRPDPRPHPQAPPRPGPLHSLLVDPSHGRPMGLASAPGRLRERGPGGSGGDV